MNLNDLFGIKHRNLEDLCKILKLDKQALKEFEDAYKIGEIPTQKRLRGKTSSDISKRIVDELIASTKYWEYVDGKISLFSTKALPNTTVTSEELKSIPLSIRPQVTGTLMKVDLDADSGYTLLENLTLSKIHQDPEKRKKYYFAFRQGLDLLDLDSLTYAMIDRNPDSMGYWLPAIIPGIEEDGFFKVPDTKIIKVPMPLLQLTRIGYEEINDETKAIVNEYCNRIFNLDPNKTYFIKTGTYSSKYDFRNAKVDGESEVLSIGEYFLYNHSKALEMAQFDTSGAPVRRPVIYGASTTTEWVVRDFINDSEDNLSIYHGLPLHTEYRVFVDLDTKEVLGIHPYWEKDLLEKHYADTIRGVQNYIQFIKENGTKVCPDPEGEILKATRDLNDAKHDILTYTGNFDELNRRYEENKDTVVKHMEKVIESIPLTGQWSIDVMQNGDDFYIIDMHGASRSTFYKETVPENKRKPSEEDWIPILESPSLEKGKPRLLEKK